jgi:DNA primase
LSNGFLPEEKISEIRDRSSILEVVSDYVSLKKAGKNYKGLCPFHSEKTPSFMVNEEKQVFHCFGCGEGGNVFAFLMKVGHFSFPQAAEELARRYGVKLPSRELSLSQKKEMAKREVLFQINETASQYFSDLLTRRKEGEEGRRYLSQRGISQEIIEEHRLGCSLERWDGLVQHLRERGVPLEMARELGLVFPQKKVGDRTLREGPRLDSTGWYDSFRGRVLFPIFDLQRRVVGFGGRLIKEGQPKYLNSSESSIYHKGEILYGLHVAKRYAPEKDCVIIAEGYFDLLTLHQYGMKHSVATLGTALTTQHIRTLRRYTKNLITVFDADPAGIQATLRSLPLFLEEGVVGKTIALPEGEDPDGFLRKWKVGDFEKRVAMAVPLIDFFFEGLMKTHDVKSIEGKVKAAQEGVALIGKIPEKIRRDFYLKVLAERLDLQEAFLYEMLESPPRSRLKVSEDLKERFIDKSSPKSEEMVVRLMVHHPELIPIVSDEGILEEFESPVLRRIGEELQSLYQKKRRLDVAEMLGFLEEDLGKRLSEFVFQASGLEGGDLGKILQDCLQKIRKKKLRKERSESLKRIKEAEKQQGGRSLDSLLEEHQQLAKRERVLQKDSFRKE